MVLIKHGQKECPTTITTTTTVTLLQKSIDQMSMFCAPHKRHNTLTLSMFCLQFKYRELFIGKCNFTGNFCFLKTIAHRVQENKTSDHWKYLQTESHIFPTLLNHLQSHTTTMATFVLLRHPVTILVTDLTSDLLFINSFDNKEISLIMEKNDKKTTSRYFIRPQWQG